MRHHGWQLPYHPLQVIAIAVFISLAFAFYVFFIPFVGSKLLQYHVIALFSPLVIVVFALYIRCAAANPADPGLERYSKQYKKCCSKKSSAASSLDVPASKKSSQLSEPTAAQTSSRCASVLCFPCAAVACCFRKIFGPATKDKALQQDLVYCKLCEAEIFKLSKHCRACDKCVEGFDHHCRWINNCIGKRNYKTFVALMVTSLLLLALESGIGIFVIVRCVLNRLEFEEDIVSKLGSSFSLVPFLVVVALCTLLAMMATFPLGQLFFFHVVLIHKGITTYDYITAMRERDELQDTSSESSPSSSAGTAVSGASSVGMLQRRPWCTPPRLFVEQQDTTIRDPFAPDLELQGGKEVMAAGKKEDPVKKHKKVVKINPWKLARLNAEDAAKASARARENSSILRPINDTSVITETDNSSCEGRSPANEIVPVSRKSKRKRDLTSPGVSASRERPPRDRKHESNNGNARKPPIAPQPSLDLDESIAPLQLEAQSAFWPRSKGLVPAISLLSPDEVHARPTALASSPSPAKKPWLQRSVSDGYDASGGESADDSEHGRRLAHAWSKLKQSSTFMNSSSSQLPLPLPSNKNTLRYSADALRQMKMGAVYAGQTSSVQKFAAPPSTPSDDSNSLPSQYNSPDRDSDFFSAGDHLSSMRAPHLEPSEPRELSSRSGSARSMASLH